MTPNCMTPDRMTPDRMTPETTPVHRPAAWRVDADPRTWRWCDVEPLPPLLRADGSGPAIQQTEVRTVADANALYVRFDCADRDIWATYTCRDDPIYDEEVVEVFLAPGAEVPRRYVEIEVSPDGVLFDAVVDNPNNTRAAMSVDVAWSCPGIRWYTERDDSAGRWSAIIVLPRVAVAAACGGEPGPTWRGNFYRIERPRDSTPEFSCWSPTRTDPADFHRPAAFGTLHGW